MPYGITIDEVGDVYVVDWRNDRVQKFTADGEFIMEFGSSGCDNGEFNRPTGIAVDHSARSTSPTPATTGYSSSTRRRVRAEVPGRRDAVQGGARLHAHQRLPQPPARHANMEGGASCSGLPSPSAWTTKAVCTSPTTAPTASRCTSTRPSP